jgi:hypothetical protein
MGIKRVGVVVSLAALISLAGCGSSSGRGGSSATTTTASVASTTSAGATTTTTSATADGGRDAFVGTWNVHGGVMTIPATGNVTITYADGTKAQMLHLSAELSPDADRLHLTVLDAGLVDGMTSSTVPSDGIPDSEFVAGDTMELTKVRPGELQFVNIKTKNKPLEGGNPYWCGKGIDPAHQSDCGA